MTLRARLLLALLALAAVGIALVGTVTYRQQHDFLMSEIDRQLSGNINSDVARRSLNESLQTGQPERVLSSTPFVMQVKTPFGTTGTITSGQATPTLRWDKDGYFTIGSPHYRALAINDRQGNEYVAAISLSEVDRTLHHLLAVELITAIAVLTGLGVVAFWVVKLGLKPLHQMQETAGAIAAGDLSQRVEVDDPTTEVGQLGLALNEMMSKIEKAFAERTASEERLRRFVGDASHELRTPLTSIRGYAELFRRGAAERPEDLEKAMRRIEEEASRMGVMVDDLLLLARLDQKRPIEHQPVDLTRITSDAVDDTRAVAPERIIDYSPNGAIVVPGDEVRLRQVLANLLTNAVRHTPSETPVHVQVTTNDDEAVIEVRDEGPGMPAEDAARVFERFWRSDGSRNRASGGTGLGLAIVSAIAEAHGGTAEVLTEPGAGATFRVHLPRHESPFAPPEPAPTPG